MCGFMFGFSILFHQSVYLCFVLFCFCPRIMLFRLQQLCIMNGCGISSNAFSASIEMIMCFLILPFVNVVYITLIDLAIFNYP